MVARNASARKRPGIKSGVSKGSQKCQPYRLRGSMILRRNDGVRTSSAWRDRRAPGRACNAAPAGRDRTP